MTAAGTTDSGMATLLRLTEDMLTLAAQGEWDAVRAHEAQRQAVIQTLPPLEVDADGVHLGQFKQMVDKNTRIVDLALSEKNRIADELKSVRNLAKAEQFYRQIDDNLV